MFKLIPIIFLIVSCGNLTTNLVDEESFYLRNAFVEGEKVNAEFKFQRYSWYKEMSLAYDMMLTKIDSGSKLYGWLSESSKKDVQQCSEFYVGLLYSLENKYISHRNVTKQMDTQGGEEQVIPDFYQNFKNHPDYEAKSLQLYRVRGFCFKNPITKDIVLKLPGYRNVTVIKN